LEVLPERRGVLILDGTSFPKQGPHSVGVARQYCGALGKIANCQVAVTAALWTGARAWFLGALLYLPESWASDPTRRTVAHIPASVTFQEKWRQALTLLRRARGARLDVTAVLADAEFGDVAAFRRVLHQWRLPYALGVSRQLTVFRGTPAVYIPPDGPRGRPRSQLTMRDPKTRAIDVRTLALSVPASRWRRVSWRNGTHRPWAARFVAMRVTPATEWRNRRLAPEVWLLCEQDLGTTPRTKYYFINLPATASLSQLVRLAHQRWAIEQQYQELKTELGLDHFEGRSFPGWQHHVVLSALAYTFLQKERRRPDVAPTLTLPGARAFITEIFTALLLAQKPHYLTRMQELAEIQLRI
jgi:SRSO17 transposase